MNTIKSKRFVVRKSLIGTNTIIEFTNKKGDTYTYNHDKVWEIMKDKLAEMPCWLKYKSYTATNNIPLVCRNVELVVIYYILIAVIICILIDVVE